VRGALEGNLRIRDGRLSAGATERLFLRLQFFDVGEQLLFVRQAAHEKAEHLVGAKGWLPTRPQRDQQACDDRDVRLYLDSVLAVAQQVPTAQNVLEEAKKRLNLPRTLRAKRQLLTGRRAGR